MQPGMMLQAMGMPQNVTMCYKEGCHNLATKQCKCFIYCKDYGCGKMMCDEHHNTKCIARGRDRSIYYVCLECEGKAHRCTVMGFLFPVCSMCSCFAAIIILSIIFGDNSSDDGLNTDEFVARFRL